MQGLPRLTKDFCNDFSRGRTLIVRSGEFRRRSWGVRKSTLRSHTGKPVKQVQLLLQLADVSKKRRGLPLQFLQLMPKLVPPFLNLFDP
jgi:hypothetical protein